tara:strand:+ start:60 stop:1271 length:1212 start_codon:yes stop_codon:yes gene_type:complete
MAETVATPKPIERLKNLNLLQTDLTAYILEEIGVNISEHDAPKIPSNADDIKSSVSAHMAQASSKYLSANILQDKATGNYKAVVCLAFKAGPGGVQSCKAIIPTVHSNVDNPFAVTNEDVRAEMISHLMTFSHNMSESSSPIMPGSIIEVSLDNPNSYWTSGTIEKILKGKPEVMPEYALQIEGALDLFNNPVAWLTAALFGAPPAPFTDTQSCKEPRTAEDILQAYGSVGSGLMNIEIAQKMVAVAKSVGMGDPGWLANVIYFESARTFDPGIYNKKTEAIKSGTGASGLIQFIPSTAKKLGTTIAEIRQMDSLEQLDYVGKYFSSYSGRLNSQSDVLAAVFFPKAIGNPGFNIYEYFVNKRGKEWADKNYLGPNNGIIYMQEYANSALAAAKLTCREDLLS